MKLLGKRYLHAAIGSIILICLWTWITWVTDMNTVVVFLFSLPVGVGIGLGAVTYMKWGGR